MKSQIVPLIVLAAFVTAGCAAKQLAEAPNDSISRGLNEMKAKARVVPPAADPRDGRITDLEKQISDRDAELGRFRSASGNLTEANRRASDLERQLADRDRELAAMRSNAGDSSKLASQLSSANSDLDRANRRVSDLESQLAALQGSTGDKDKLVAELASAKQRAADLERQLAAMQGAAGDKDKLAAELASAKQRVVDLEKQLADRDAELARLHGDLSAEMAKLKDAQRGIVKALRPEINKGDITVDLNNERLLINLASAYLFGSGEDQLKPAGANALKRVGAILKDYPEYKVAVDGHTDNRPIRSELKKRFPTNKELSEARATNAAKALSEGGVSGAGTMGYADTKPVAPNTSDTGRAKNRRVEVRVTPKS